jgi:hypothetical protein
LGINKNKFWATTSSRGVGQCEPGSLKWQQDTNFGGTTEFISEEIREQEEEEER